MGRANSFDLLRLVAATMVLFGHSFVLLGQPAPNIFGEGIHAAGVDIFFAISGYLISRSLSRDSRAMHFFWKRVLRIFPGIAFCILLTVLWGQFITTLPVVEYWTHPLLLAYLKNIFLAINYVLPGVFSANPVPWAVNGSLWSLPAEALMYVTFFFFAMTKRAAGLFAVLVYFVLVFYLVPEHGKFQIWSAPLYQIAPVAAFFLVGFLMDRWKEYLRQDVEIAVCAIVIITLTSGTNLGVYLVPTIGVYALITIANKPSRLSRVITSFGDISYGMYLYAYPVQQSLIYFLGPEGLSPLLLAVGTLVVTVPLATISWRLVEKPALQMKDRFVGAPVLASEARIL